MPKRVVYHTRSVKYPLKTAVMGVVHDIYSYIHNIFISA